MTAVVANQDIHIAMGADEGYALPLAAALASLDDASRADRVIVHILHERFSQALRDKVAARLTHLEIDWVRIDAGSLAGASFPSFLSVGTLYRLLLGEVLPAGIHRVLYLDADTLITDSVAELFAAELHGNAIAAVRDASTPWAACMLGSPWRQWNMDPASPYFNAGVLLIDLDRWRTEQIGQRSIELLKSFTPRWGDQDALNAIIGSRWQQLPRRWNMQTPLPLGDSPDWALWSDDAHAALEAPAVVHFTGLDKPWGVGSTHPFTPLWREWLDRTAWAGWRPSEPQPGLLERLSRAAVRRARAVREAARRRAAAKRLTNFG
ncbi:glycosyltransferase family 8 protein [Gryllotalpicola koreensis]|uniref:Glycosyltransferase family 8 protein n=1 Tax=Gryllotalpicola koreensis TaxID=993086 RepID=A0ABP7ZPF0_9MICO